jgi:hypothetical protein
VKFLELNGVLSNKQKDKLQAFLVSAEQRLSREPDVQALITVLSNRLADI